MLGTSSTSCRKRQGFMCWLFFYSLLHSQSILYPLPCSVPQLANLQTVATGLPCPLAFDWVQPAGGEHAWCMSSLLLSCLGTTTSEIAASLRLQFSLSLRNTVFPLASSALGVSMVSSVTGFWVPHHSVFIPLTCQGPFHKSLSEQSGENCFVLRIKLTQWKSDR